MAKPISFGEHHFKTKKAATEEIRERINSYEAGNILSVDDSLFFNSLFTLHDQYEEKKGTGIEHIQVERDFHNNRCLYIHRTDGTKIDISWVHCLRPATIKQTASMAFRRAVKDKITSFKASMISSGSVCPVLGIPLNFDNSHVGYTRISFDKLVQDFLSKTANTFESIHLTNPNADDTDQRAMISSEEVAIAWRAYHEESAHIELLSAKANLSKTTC